MTVQIEQLEQRTDRLESELSKVVDVVSELAKNTTQLTTNVNHLDGNVTAIFHKIDGLTKPKATPWQTILMAVGLIVTIGGLAMTPFYQRVSKAESHIEEIQNRLIEQAELNGYQRAHFELLMKELER